MSRLPRQISILLFVAPTAACFDPGFLPPSCDDEPRASAACHGAADLFRYLTPQLARGVVVGNTTPGTGGVMRKGHIGSLSANVSMANGTRTPALGPTAGASISTNPQTTALARIDATLGVIPRIGGAVGVDLLASVSTVPRASLRNVTIRSGSNVSLGYGLRLGLAQQATGPSFAITGFAMQPQWYELTAVSADGTMRLSQMRVASSTVQLTTGYQGKRFGFATGFGRVLADGTTTVSGIAGGFTSPGVDAEYAGSGNTVFLDGTMRVGPGKLVIGIGRVGAISEDDAYYFAPARRSSYAPAGASTTLTIGTRIGG